MFEGEEEPTEEGAQRPLLTLLSDADTHATHAKDKEVEVHSAGSLYLNFVLMCLAFSANHG
jgi:hypothetical protein